MGRIRGSDGGGTRGTRGRGVGAGFAACYGRWAWEGVMCCAAGEIGGEKLCVSVMAIPAITVKLVSMVSLCIQTCLIGTYARADDVDRTEQLAREVMVVVLPQSRAVAGLIP